MKKLKKKIFKNKKAELDFYWWLSVLCNANFECEISGASPLNDPEVVLQGHHLRGKRNENLRYSLLNGICVTSGHHRWGFHDVSKASKYEGRVKVQRGEKIFDSIGLIGDSGEKETHAEIEQRLLSDLAKHEPMLRRFVLLKNYRGEAKAKFGYLFGKIEKGLDNKELK